MARSLLVIVPSRGRPELCREMVESFLATIRPGGLTKMIIYLNTDDILLGHYDLPQHEDIRVLVGPKQFIADTFNQFCVVPADYYANLNDDHLFVTDRWDARLIALNEQEMNGWGIACADDRLTDWNAHPHPSGCVISGKAVRLLGWIAPPGTRHIGIDVIQGKLFGGLGLLRLDKNVVIEHRHWVNGMRPMDDNYKWVYGREEQGHGDEAVRRYLLGAYREDRERLRLAMDIEAKRAVKL